MQRESSNPVLVLGKDIALPEGVVPGQISDGYHTFSALYAHRISLFIALMQFAAAAGWLTGWSRKHADGLPCFDGSWVLGWIVTPSGLEIRYHLEDTWPLPPHLEQPVGLPWNGREETLEALESLFKGIGR